MTPRFEYDLQTQELSVILQRTYVSEDGLTIVLIDDGKTPPEGFIEQEDVE